MQLVTNEIARALEAASRLPDRDPADTPIIVKLFTPDADATWFITEGEHVESDWRLFGFCDLGDRRMAELGYVMLSEIQAVQGGLGLPVERDLHFEGTLRDVLRQYGKDFQSAM